MPDQISFRDALNAAASTPRTGQSLGQARVVDRIPVPACSGRAVRLAQGQFLRVVNVKGGQIGDLFAFSATDDTEQLSPSQTRNFTFRTMPQVGQSFHSTHRRPLLTVIEDRSPGKHDMMFHACSKEFYEFLGGGKDHRNCHDNYHDAVKALLGRHVPIPDPLNIFQHTPLLPSGEIDVRPAPAAAGDFITLRAEIDLICVLTACAWDLDPDAAAPGPLHMDILA